MLSHAALRLRPNSTTHYLAHTTRVTINKILPRRLFLDLVEPSNSPSSTICLLEREERDTFENPANHLRLLLLLPVRHFLSHLIAIESPTNYNTGVLVVSQVILAASSLQLARLFYTFLLPVYVPKGPSTLLVQACEVSIHQTSPRSSFSPCVSARFKKFIDKQPGPDNTRQTFEKSQDLRLPRKNHYNRERIQEHDS